MQMALDRCRTSTGLIGSLPSRMDMEKILHVIPSRFEHDFKIRSLPAAQASLAAIHFPKGASGQGALRHEFHSRPAVVRCHDHPIVANSVAFNPHVKVGKNPTPKSPRGPAFPIGNRHLPRPVGQYHTCATPAGDHSKAISLDPQPAGPPRICQRSKSSVAGGAPAIGRSFNPKLCGLPSHSFLMKWHICRKQMIALCCEPGCSTTPSRGAPRRWCCLPRWNRSAACAGGYARLPPPRRHRSCPANDRAWK